MDRLAEPEEIGRLAAFLASDLAANMTGACLTAAAGTSTVTTRAWPTGVVGVNCLTDTSESTDTKAVVSVAANGNLTCAFGA